MINLLDVLSHDTELDWIVARVEEVYTAPPRFRAVVGPPQTTSAPSNVTSRTTTDHYMRIHDVSYLDGYTPVVGDTVHIIVKSNIGALCLGKVAT
jgi:hypothetical protein